jgi:hypothetical protein
MQKNAVIRFLASLAIVWGLAAAAQGAERVYRWVDEQGVVHYGQQPSPIYKSEAIEVQKGYSTAAEDNEKATEEELKAADEAEYCRIATENFEALSSEGEVQRKDEYGELHTMTEEQKQTERDRAKEAMDRYCAPAEEEE